MSKPQLTVLPSEDALMGDEHLAARMNETYDGLRREQRWQPTRRRDEFNGRYVVDPAFGASQRATQVSKLRELARTLEGARRQSCKPLPPIQPRDGHTALDTSRPGELRGDVLGKSKARDVRDPVELGDMISVLERRA